MLSFTARFLLVWASSGLSHTQRWRLKLMSVKLRMEKLLLALPLWKVRSKASFQKERLLQSSAQGFSKEAGLSSSSVKAVLSSLESSVGEAVLLKLVLRKFCPAKLPL